VLSLSLWFVCVFVCVRAFVCMCVLLVRVLVRERVCVCVRD
jgi:hypothetical protein